MKKIMFNDRYGLTQAVLEGKKTMTRRSVKWNILCGGREDTICVVAVKELPDGRRVFTTYNTAGNPVGQAVSPYRIGEEVAIAQAYQTLRWPALPGIDWKTITDEVTHSKGWTNKMFVKAEYMPHRIRINNIKVERLQDISEEDCLREGIQEYFDGWRVHGIGMTIPKGKMPPIAQTTDGKPYYSDRYRDFKFNSPREAFSALIDRISGKGTWNRNPWAFPYEFELIK